MVRFVLDTGTGTRECAAEVASDDVAVVDLLRAAGVTPTAAVHVDGRRVPTDHLLAEAAICEGSTLSLVPPPRPSSRAAATDVADLPAPRLEVVAGTGAGRTVVLRGTVVVGRDRGCDLVVPSTTVSHEHCRITNAGGRVLVSDLGTTNGTWVGGHLVGARGVTAAPGLLVRIGAVVLRVVPPAPVDRPSHLDPVRHGTAAGTVPLNRPPRPAAPAPPAPIPLPPPPAPAATAPPFSLAALVAPLVLGAVMVVALGSWRYAAFMALSPLLLLANTLSGRRRASREGRARDRERRQALATLQQRLGAAAAAERSRRWSVVPSVVEVLRRATAPSCRLWERRRDDDDVLRLHVGVGAVPWSVPTEEQRPDDEVARLLAHWRRLPRSPVAVDLADGGVVGIVGERGPAAALARSLLLQACVHHGPADLAVAVAVDTARVGDWSWSSWLPHVRDNTGRRLLGAGTAATGRLLADLRSRDRDERTLLLVCDSPALLRGRDADARAVLNGVAGSVAGIVVAPTADQLPAVCDTIIEVDGEDGEARLTQPSERVTVDGILLAGLSSADCLPAARRLAGLEDPEHASGPATLPARVDLLDLLPDGLDVATAWDRAGTQPGLSAPIGVGTDGPVLLDLVTDGPHGLLGGTTGSGKSELLRSLVAGLAATHDPEHVTFVLLDYKGGAAFDACAGLPHVVGLVTDLDEHLGARALRCLEAELAHREGRLRDAGVSDLPAWRRLPADVRGPALPRLLVVVDEFATLRAELPDFVAALVGIAQRGRSLGVHLLLGTQRPSGAVDENVRANANLRVALRMTDDRDAVDVVGVADAARLAPERPGRGLLRTGPEAPVLLQTALVTGRSRRAAAPVSVHPVRFAPTDLPVPAVAAAAPDDDGPTDLERLVAACRDEAARRGLDAPRSPWPPPLPEEVRLEDLPPSPTAVPFGLLDDPDRQRRVTVGWEPESGNLLVHGAVGSGTTSTLASLVVSAATHHAADALHLYVLDLGRGGLAALAGLPHCGAVVTAREPERRARLEVQLLTEAARRRRLTEDELASAPLHLLVVDGLADWLSDLDDPATYELFEAVQRLIVDAPGLRMAVVGSVPRPGALRGSVLASVEHHLLHRLADPSEVAVLGLRPTDVPDLPPGRAVRPGGGLQQIARVPDLTAAVRTVATTTGPPACPPAPIGVLPAALPAAEVADGWSCAAAVWRVPVGRDAVTLAPVGWELHTGDHAVVLGPPASGRSGLLAGLASAAPDDVHVVVVSDTGTWPPGVDVRGAKDLADVLAGAASATGRVLVLIDDADRLPDPGPVLEAVAASASVRLVVAGRQEVVQSDYGHWLRRLARARTGLFLRPMGDVPDELLGARLPRRAPVATRASRGWLVTPGAAQFVQTVVPAA